MTKRHWATLMTATVSVLGYGQTLLVKDGTPLGVIVHSGWTNAAPDLSATHVRQGHIPSPAHTLQTYLKEMTGVELPLVATPEEAGDRPAFVLRQVEKVPGSSARPTAAQAYRLKTEGHRLEIMAATPLGLHLAVYGLLEDHLGCRFYRFQRKGLSYAGRGFEVVPRSPPLALPVLDDFQEPAFANRGIIYWPGSYPWILQNRGIGQPADPVSGALAAHHNFYDLVPPQDKKRGQETVKGLFAEHPEFYPMNREGRREPTWAMGLCGTQPELPKYLTAGLKEAIERRLAQARGGPVDWSLPIPAAQGDGFSGCQCPECRKRVADEQSEAAPLILMLNRALEIVSQEYPQVRVITFAYFDTLDAPKTLKPHSNLWINVVSSSRSQNVAGDQVGPIADNPANRDYARALREWPLLAPDRVTVWHWDSYRPEWPSVFFVKQNVQYWRAAGMYGVNPQFCGGPWVDLLAWLYLKLLWNPEADDQALVRQFCEDNYGKEAGGYVFDYLKVVHEAYLQSLHVPSAVRWSGWTPLLRLKCFPPSRLARMTELMDRAVAAAEKAGDPQRLANLLADRGQSLDVVILNDVAASGRPWGPVRFEGDGKDWYVAGADPRVPPALMRAKKGIVMDGGGEQGVMRTLAGYAWNHGGPLVSLTSPAMTAAVCPELRGQIVSVVDRPSGKELLAGQEAETGYRDLFQGINAQIWLPAPKADEVVRRMNDDWSRLWSDFQNERDDTLETCVVLSPSQYGFDPSRRLIRVVRATENGLQIERTYTGKLDNPNRFTTRWRLLVPEPRTARVLLKGGGVDEMLDLRYAVPGGIRGVKAGEKLPGADYMDERFDTVIAVSDAESLRRTLAADRGESLAVTVDRGDGLAVSLETPVMGWDVVEVKPVVEHRFVEITLVGAPQEGGAATNLVLPPQTLSVRTVPPRSADQADRPDLAERPAPQIRLTGPNTAINERDGAELVWVPSGEFVRGSDRYSDERPSRTIQLDGFWIYRTPVTVAQYRKFCEATGKEFKPTWGQGMHAEPTGEEGAYAVQCNWYEADAYASWAGAALPSEAQWEKAARGTDGREYPWGNEWKPEKCVSMENTIYRYFTPGFRPVGSHPDGASPYGVLDMAGNVWEWVADWYDHEYFAAAPKRNPPGPARGTHKVLRGGCSLYDERFSRCTARMPMPPHVRDWTPTGFRCVVHAPGPGAVP
jgi:iron(II)-dependent oxidoreductase